ncbi:hypothetical protein GGX14DRAFT_570453 [Mycena pura]|uniref:Uncharacterized protein n=1 Tax=Mycena pura TaxID=153505 RepID=A0AAD6Y6Z9_9AGAR|nr:hypothetical protein GGX14DRAFT_570453 [Mycena pura]
MSPPGTPNHSHDFNAEMQDIIVLFTPSKSGREIAQAPSICANEQDRITQDLKRRLIDAENDADIARKRLCRGRNNRTEGVAEVSPNFTVKELGVRARRQGRKFVILCSPWLALGDGDVESFFTTELDDNYDEEMRFSGGEDEVDERQGQLRKSIDILPDDLEPFRTRPWLAKSFVDGMKSQCSNTHTRLRKHALQHILTDLVTVPTPAPNAASRSTPVPDAAAPEPVTPAQLASSTSRFRHFAVRIGWREDKQKYSIWHVPFLHGNESERLDYNQLFRHSLLLMVFTCIIRGAAAAEGVMGKVSQHSKAKTMQKMFNITSTTPGAIAACAIWVIWLFSADKSFGKVGDVTGINYYDHFNLYLEKILEGLRLRQRWVRELFLYWDGHVFPEWNGARFGGGVDPDDDDEREELAEATAALHDMPVVSDDDEEGED